MRYGKFDINHGDRVSFARCNSLRHGKANGLLMFAGHLVLDMGGPHGKPCVVFPDEIVAVKPRKESA